MEDSLAINQAMYEDNMSDVWFHYFRESPFHCVSSLASGVRCHQSLERNAAIAKTCGKRLVQPPLACVLAANARVQSSSAPDNEPATGVRSHGLPERSDRTWYPRKPSSFAWHLHLSLFPIGKDIQSSSNRWSQAPNSCFESRSSAARSFHEKTEWFCSWFS